jgi:formate/nitrite transporter FocA (FNT family)
MDYVKPIEVTKNMIEAAATKAALSVADLLIRGFLSGALLGFATTLAFTATKQTSVPIVEHSVVNMFVIPTGMMLGAKVSVADWWLWNQIPVTLGNLLGGWLLIGLPLFLTYGKPASGQRLPGAKLVASG